ncbi:MAG TPA: ArsI/CadI family heavy metal resistance metalloenzyme [Leptolyngbyaceae cyanobacterium]
MATFKTHVALRVTNLERSIAFYQTLFGLAPVKHKPDYAKFDIDNPGLNLTLNVSEGIAPHGALSHLGVQVDSTETVRDAIARLKAVGLTLLEEHNTDCCYALQDKVWVSDPDGNRWEIFVVKVADTAPEKNISEKTTLPGAQAQASCCA